MAFKQANKPYNNGERNWVKISQAHVDAKREIMEASLKEQCFGWSYSPATMQVQSIVDWLFNPSLVGTATHGYRAYLNTHGEYVIDVTRTRNAKQKLTEPELTPTVLTELLSGAKLGTYIQLRVKLCNSDVRSKSRKPIPDTTFLIINLNKLETGELRSSSHFDSSTFRRIVFSDLEGLAIRLVKDRKSKLSTIIPFNADTREFITEVLRVWNRI